MKNPILYFLLLVLEIPLNFTLDTYYKCDIFFKTLSKKSLEFVSCKEDGTITFNLSLVLLLVEIDPIVEKQSRKRDAFKACGTGHVKKIFTLPTKIIALHI